MPVVVNAGGAGSGDICRSRVRRPYLLDAGSAAHAGLALAEMDEEAVLEGAALAVHVAVVVDRGALRVDSGVQGLDDRVAEQLDLRPSQGSDRSQRMDLRPEQRLVGVDVAHAGDPLLVQEECLHRLLAAACLVAERLGREVGAERLDPEA